MADVEYVQRSTTEIIIRYAIFAIAMVLIVMFFIWFFLIRTSGPNLKTADNNTPKTSQSTKSSTDKTATSAKSSASSAAKTDQSNNNSSSTKSATTSDGDINDGGTDDGATSDSTNVDEGTLPDTGPGNLVMLFTSIVILATAFKYWRLSRQSV